MSKPFTRRDFLAGASALGAASLLGIDRALATDAPPEIRTVRIADWSASCAAPQFVAEAMDITPGTLRYRLGNGIRKLGSFNTESSVHG